MFATPSASSIVLVDEGREREGVREGEVKVKQERRGNISIITGFQVFSPPPVLKRRSVCLRAKKSKKRRKPEGE